MTKPTKQCIRELLTQFSKYHITLASDIPIEPAKPSNSEMASILRSAADRIEREGKVCPARKCPWCGGVGEFEMYSGGDIRYDKCDFCKGEGKVGG